MFKDEVVRESNIVKASIVGYWVTYPGFIIFGLLSIGFKKVLEETVKILKATGRDWKEENDKKW